MNYQLTASGFLRLDDQTNIPNDTGNRDYSEYLDWLAEGNTPLPADIPPPPTPLEQIRALEQAYNDYQRRLNRQGAIDTALTIMCRSPLAQGKTRTEVHALLYAENRGYRVMVDLEAKIEFLRRQIA